MDFNHHYHANGVFLFSTEARRDPRNPDRIVEPGNTTLVAPPATGDNEVAVWDGATWSIAENHLGETYWLADGSEHVVVEIGPLPDGALTEKPTLPVYKTVDEARDAMIDWIDAFLIKIAGRYPKFESDSFTGKEEAARAFVAGSARPDQIMKLEEEASTSGKTKEQVAARIIANADYFNRIISKTSGLRQSIDEDLAAVTDPLEYEAVLNAGISSALQLAADLGISLPEAAD